MKSFPPHRGWLGDPAHIWRDAADKHLHDLSGLIFGNGDFVG